MFCFFIDLILMERINLQYAGFARVLFTSQGLTTVRAVHIRKVRQMCKNTIVPSIPIQLELGAQQELILMLFILKIDL